MRSAREPKRRRSSFARAAEVVRAAELEPLHRAPRAAPPAESASARYFAASSGLPAASSDFAQLWQAAA